MAEESMLRLPARLERLGDALDFAGGLLRAAGCPDKVCRQVDLALDEMLSNIASYSGSPEMELRCRVEAGEITLTLLDEGVPYDPLSRPEPDTTLSAEAREIGGLGVFLAKKVMDSMEYARRDGQNIVTLKKRY